MLLTLLPLIRTTLKHRPVLRDRLFIAAVGLGIVHGTWLISRAGGGGGVEEEEEEENVQQHAARERQQPVPAMKIVLPAVASERVDGGGTGLR